MDMQQLVVDFEVKNRLDRFKAMEKSSILKFSHSKRRFASNSMTIDYLIYLANKAEKAGARK